MDGHDVVDAGVSGTRVMVVDDNSTVCRSTASGLARAGYHVVTAFGGDQAIEQALATPPDVAVIDLFMPVSGLTVIRALKEAHGEAIHVIAWTANDTEDTRQASFEAGSDDFVVKPTSIEDLSRRVAVAARHQQAFVQSRLAGESAERQRAYYTEATALVAHDLRNALQGCLSTVSLAIEIGGFNEELTYLIGASERSLHFMSCLVTNILDISRFEDAAVKPKTSMVDVRALLDSVISLHASGSERRGWEIECDAALVAMYDPGLIERVLHNLVGNARRYAGANGVVRVGARPWFEAPPGSVEIAVENSGPPVPNDVVPKLFSKYGRGADGKRGLGLYFCRLACEAHGGQIAYQTVEGRPVFFVRLPGNP
jgi:signal transduction histidine kinase